MVSRGGSVDDKKLWKQGLSWLKDKDKWPADIVTSPSPESQAEAKVIKGIFAGFTAATYCLDDLLEKFNLTKTLRVVAWSWRFVGNSRLKREERMMGPLKTDEVQRLHLFWTKRAQRSLDDKVTR